MRIKINMDEAIQWFINEMNKIYYQSIYKKRPVLRLCKGSKFAVIKDDVGNPVVRIDAEGYIYPPSSGSKPKGNVLLTSKKELLCVFDDRGIIVNSHKAEIRRGTVDSYLKSD